MKNYVCLNGQKIKLTEEQLSQVAKALNKESVKLGDIPVGEPFKIGQYEFVVLEHSTETTAVILKDLLFKEEKFGSNNNFDGSHADQLCQDFALKIADIVGEDNLIEHTVDLTSDDGLKDYGSVKRKMSLLTTALYRRYVYTLDKYKPGKWWWLATAFSTATHNDTDWVKCVSPSGRIDYVNYNNNNGVRPYWWIVRQSKPMLKSEHHFNKRTHNLSVRINKKKVRCMTEFEKVIDFDNMYKAYRKSKSGKGFKKSAARFGIMALDGVNSLIEQLKSKTYTVSDYQEFKVYEPKERIIKTTSFKDKVVQHSLCDNVILPKLQEVFIFDNCAGQKGKGTLFGLNRLSEQMKAFYKRYGYNGYILKCDISKFFYNIPHEQLKDIVNYHFSYDSDICWLCNLFIDSTEGKGIPLGNQVNQGFALLYLDGMDKLITGELGIEYYSRYMDDFYLIHHSKEYLKYCLEVMSEFLKTLDLSLNGKTQIFPFKSGVNYLGFHTYISANGKLVRKLKNQNKRNAQKKYSRMAKMVVDGTLSADKFHASYNAWKNHISHGNCYKLSQSMDEKIFKIINTPSQP
ncbi:MAG: hypothetical protein IKY67_05960 [Paludibacteraceae bacterium]|nr:hypothetical protein [Paludibacteraceae bacterium]